MRAPGGSLSLVATAAILILGGCDSPSHDHDTHDHGSAESGADDDHGHGHGHGHEHSEDAIGITKFTDKLELFAEHPPAIAGKKLTFLAHLTILDGFLPVEDATVTLVVEGPERAKARVTEKLRSGIFQPTLTAPRPGKYQARLVVEGPKVQDTISGFEIVVHKDKEAAQKAAAQEQQAGGHEAIGFLKEQQWQVPFATAFAETGSVIPALEVAGEITTPPDGQADVGAPIAGRIVAPQKGLPTPGQALKRGELLATIAPAPASPEAGARADLAVVEAEARLQTARAGLERAERLIADRAISQREVDEARRELAVAEAAVKAARRARSVFAGAASGQGAGTYRISAPITGVVVEVQATAGKSVTSGETLFRIVNLDELWVRARVPEQQANLVRSDQDASFKLPGVSQWLPIRVTGNDAQGALVNVGRTVDRRSRTVDVIYALKRPDERMKVGAMVRVAVPAGDPWRGVVVPRDAVLDDDGRSVVFVQTEGESFEERTVRLGPRSGALVGIQKGVHDHERVVTRGANVIRLSAKSPSAPAHGHVH